MWADSGQDIFKQDVLALHHTMQRDSPTHDGVPAVLALFSIPKRHDCYPALNRIVRVNRDDANFPAGCQLANDSNRSTVEGLSN